MRVLFIPVLVVLFLILGACVFYTAKRFYRVSFVRKLAKKSRFAAIAVSLLPAALCASFSVINVPTAAVVLLHLCVFFAVADLTGLFIRKVVKHSFPADAVCILAFVLTAVCLGTGWVNAHNIRSTHYTLANGKSGGESLRIVLLTDSHIGITLDGKNIPALVERIRAEKPDAVLFAGDLIDESSPWPETEAVCRALGTLDAPLGTWFSFGNHDGDQYAPDHPKKSRLTGLLEENGIHCLEDETVPLCDGFLLAGRADASNRGRVSALDLLAGTDHTLYSIVMDHQPNDYAALAAAGADLVLSGHTHGGHIWPTGLIGLWIGANDRVYGTETRGGTTFIVSSGVSGWAIPFKTGTFSEYDVIDILPAAK